MTEQFLPPAVPDEIPANIDAIAILADLNRWGITDYKVEMICGLSIGYLAQVKYGNIRVMGYPKAARLYNLWVGELRIRTPRPK